MDNLFAVALAASAALNTLPLLSCVTFEKSVNPNLANLAFCSALNLSKPSILSISATALTLLSPPILCALLISPCKLSINPASLVIPESSNDLIAALVPAINPPFVVNPLPTALAPAPNFLKLLPAFVSLHGFLSPVSLFLKPFLQPWANAPAPVIPNSNPAMFSV